MDLSLYTSDLAAKPFDVIIKHPVTGKDTDNIISVIGIDSAAAQNCMDSQQSKRFEEMTAEGEAKYDPAKQRADVIELLVACTVGWKNLEWQGDTLTFNEANARMVYEKIPTIREQVNKAVGARKNFFKD
jgi:hypothetical protein